MSALETINFTRGVPANESFPTADLSACSTAALAANADAMLQYGPAAGFAPLRNWLADWQGVQPEQVLTGNGSLEIVEFLCTAMIKPGDVVFTEAPSYDRAITIFRRHGANVIGVPLQSDGPDIAALEKLLAQHKPKLFYVIPDFQNPSGATCSAAKRGQIVALAEKHDFLLIEDAPYRLLRYRGVQEPTLFSLAPQRTLHMTSFTKLIAPGVRLGFMIGDAGILAKIGKVAEDTYISPGYFAHGVTLEWL
jgi:DNA-binding transcriptional MocR family regulator